MKMRKLIVCLVVTMLCLLCVRRTAPTASRTRKRAACSRNKRKQKAERTQVLSAFSYFFFKIRFSMSSSAYAPITAIKKPVRLMSPFPMPGRNFGRTSSVFSWSR